MTRYRFADCRYELGKPGRGRELYLEGHIPGAAFLDLDTELSDLSIPDAGRHPLPSAERFADAVSRAGIEEGVLVVAYDQGMTGGAARLWWLLRHFGHDHVAVLEGGIGAWLGPLQRGEEAIEPAAFKTRRVAGNTIDADEILERRDDPRLVVVDARRPERFRGEVEPVDPVAGHIPGAVNVPFDSPDALPLTVREADELAVYCGSGVTACAVLLRLAQAGRPDARLYPGSWSEWSTRGLPAASGLS